MVCLIDTNQNAEVNEFFEFTWEADDFKPVKFICTS